MAVRERDEDPETVPRLLLGTLTRGAMFVLIPKSRRLTTKGRRPKLVN